MLKHDQEPALPRQFPKIEQTRVIAPKAISRLQQFRNKRMASEEFGWKAWQNSVYGVPHGYCGLLFLAGLCVPTLFTFMADGDVGFNGIWRLINNGYIELKYKHIFWCNNATRMLRS